MNTIDFCFWLQGCFEVNDLKELNETQTKIVKDHLNLVFKHEIDPLRESETTTPAIELNQAHSGISNDTLFRC